MTPTSNLDGVALQSSDPGFADECLGYNRLVTHRPEVVVGAASPRDVVAAVRHAREHDWSVGVAATGHGPTRPVSGVLVTTRRMTGVSVDPDAGTATVRAGTRAGDVVAAAAEHGLAPLNGSSPNVGFVGYTLGGGVPLLGRRYGYAANRVRRIELVTAESEQRTLGRGDGDLLLWAVLGGNDNFGIVTELEVDLCRSGRSPAAPCGGAVPRCPTPYDGGSAGPTAFPTISVPRSWPSPCPTSTSSPHHCADTTSPTCACSTSATGTRRSGWSRRCGRRQASCRTPSPRCRTPTSAASMPSLTSRSGSRPALRC